MRELELITKAKNGDRDAFCGLYDIYKDRLFRYAFYRLRNHQDAEDAVSECVLSAWRQIGQIRKPEAFASWIFRIMAASCNRAVKQQIEAKQTVSLDDLSEGAQINTHQDGTDKGIDTALILMEAISELSESERNMVLLSVIGGLNSKEVSEITGLAPGSVRSSLSRSIKKVRGYLE